MGRWASPAAAGSFTLVELLIVIAVSGVLFLALASFTRLSLNTTEVLQDQNLAQQTARTALARLAAEASLAKQVTTALANRLAFTCTDITGDGADDTVEYRWDSTARTLTRTLNGNSATFAENVAAFTLEYQYETESSATFSGPGETIPLTLGQFTGLVGGADAEDAEIDVNYGTWYVEQTFNSLMEASTITSVTVRARTLLLPPAVDMYVTVDDLSKTLATGWLRATQLIIFYQDITVPMTWCGGSTTISPGKTYRIRFRPGGDSPYRNYAGTLQYQRIKSGPGLGGGMTLSYWDADGRFQTFGNMASLYFTVRGALSVTTPRRGSTVASVLKKVKATIRVTEDQQQAEHSRTWKVVNQ